MEKNNKGKTGNEMDKIPYGMNLDDFVKSTTEMGEDDINMDDFVDDTEEFTMSPQEFLRQMALLGGQNPNMHIYQTHKEALEDFPLPTPKEIKEHLDKYVIGQDEAKKTLAVAAYNHYKRIRSGNTNLDKSNVMMVGPTGSGKTLMVKTLAKLMKVPCYIGNATSITASGYVGDDIESLLVGLLREADYDVEAAQKGIVFIDEIDKSAKKDAGVSVSRDVSGECVQQGLLKMVEGNLVGVPPHGGRKHPEQQLTYIDTTNILFIASGAFPGIEDIVKHRLGTTKIGFSTDDDELRNMSNEDYMNYVSTQDLKTFGMIPEFIGRFPIIVNTNKIEKEDLKRILVEPVNSLTWQYKEMFKMDNVDLTFNEDALDTIAGVAYDLRTGARGLRNILETVLIDYMFDIPEKELIITDEIVKSMLDGKKRYKMSV